jgi:aspartate/methionine/tyrosine aminotransferase
MSNSSTPPSASQPFTPAKRVQGFGATVFAEFTALANEHQAVNLGQGFPNFPAPDFVKDAARNAIAADLNQYARGGGHPRLVNAVADVYGPLFGRELDPMTNVLITVGATEGIFATIQALVDPGDEVILIEPFYDSYPATVIMAGGTPVYVPLRFAADATSAGEWTLDMDELAAAFSPRTRLIILNTPHNPVGKVFTRGELMQIAALVQKYDALVLSDEVYEWMVYPEVGRAVAHVRMATLPGMWERTITLGSAGKTFSVTGWKVGWAIGPAALIRAAGLAHQWIPFAVATPLQEAVAIGLEQSQERGYFAWLAAMYQAKRDKLLRGLEQVRLTPMRPDGSYFILVDTRGLDVPVPDGMARDIAVCRWLTTEVGVAAIPPSAFYSDGHKHLVENLARFTFCKTDEMLDQAVQRLAQALG